MKRLISTIVACLALLVAGCGDDDSSTESDGSAESTAAESPAIESSGDASGRSKPTVKVPDGDPPRELAQTELIEGTGTEAKSGDKLTVQYVGVNFKDGNEFDSSWTRGEPYPFTLGAGEVLPGWDQGVEGMKVGGQRELVIPPELGYGEAGFPPAIPPNETLVFVIDLLEVR